MVDPIKGCAEVNLHSPILLPTIDCSLQLLLLLLLLVVVVVVVV